jgi:uncharacterized protein YaaN involved in tellurite resistance
MFRMLPELRGLVMSGAKIDQALQAEAAERAADRDAILQVMEAELDKLSEIIQQIAQRVTDLEASRPIDRGDV